MPVAKQLKGIEGAALTRVSLDKTLLLQELLSKSKISPLELLGEMQYAFVTFMLGENFESFEHWKKLVILLS